MIKFNVIFTFIFILIAESWAIDIRMDNVNVGLLMHKGKVSTGEVQIKDNLFQIHMQRNHLDLVKTDDEFIVTNPDIEAKLTVLKLKDQASFLKKLHELTIKNANLSLNKSLDFWANYLSANYDSQNLEMENFRFNCPSISKDILESCLAKADLSIASLKLPEMKLNELLDDSSNTEHFQSELLVATKVKDFNLSFLEHKFSGSAAVRMLLDIKFDFSGKVDIDEENKLIIISNLSVNRGPISLTNVVLDSIKNAKIQGITVTNNQILIQI